MIDNVEATLLPKRISVNFVGGLCQEIEPCLNMLEKGGGGGGADNV